MQLTKDQLTQRLVDLVNRMCAQMRPESDDEWSDLELTMPQFRAICLLDQGSERMVGPLGSNPLVRKVGYSETCWLTAIAPS